MNSKTSLFNKTFIKTDIKRYWWISALMMALLALFVLPNVIQSMHPDDKIVYYAASDEGLLAFAAAFFAGGFIFSYLHKSSSVSAMHGIPVSRAAQFVSHYFTCALLIAVPVIISAIVMTLELKAYDLSIEYAVKYLYICGVYTFLMLSLSVFCTMISGNIVAAYIFECGFVILPMFLASMLEYLFSINFYGYVSGNLDDIIYKIYIMGIENMWSKNSLILIAVAAILTVASFILYQKRQLEYFDDIVVFKSLRCVFVIVVTACFSMIGIYLFDQLYGISNVAAGIPLGLIALVAVHMINKKAVTFKGLLKPVVVFEACIFAAFALLELDITGFQTRVPNAEDVASISIVDRYTYLANYDYITSSTKGAENVSYRDIVPEVLVTEPDEIEKIIDLHKDIAELGKLDAKEYVFDFGDSVCFSYTMNNGTKLERVYSLPVSFINEYYDSYVSTDAYKLNNYPILNDNPDKTITSVYYSDMGINVIELSGIDSNTLIAALKKDISSAPPEELVNTYYSNIRSIEISYNETINYNGRDLIFPFQCSINIYDDFENTLKLLNAELSKQVYKSSIINADDITGAYMDYSRLDYDDEVVAYDTVEETVKIDDADMKEIFNTLASMHSTHNYDNVYQLMFTFKTADKGDYEFDINYNYDSLPDVIKKYLSVQS